jgi:hypothetical protein
MGCFIGKAGEPLSLFPLLPVILHFQMVIKKPSLKPGFPQYTGKSLVASAVLSAKWFSAAPLTSLMALDLIARARQGSFLS